MTTVEFMELPTPGLETGIWILQLIAESLHRVFTKHYKQIAVDCARRELGLADIARILGGFASQRLPTVGNSPETLAGDHERVLKDIWDDFFRENRIRILPSETLHLLREAEAETRKKLSAGKPNFSWLEHAHLQARQFVKHFLKSRTLVMRGPVPFVKVIVVEDLSAQMFCASTQRGRGEIRWAHQNVPHALLNMLVAERVLAHEYLSHLIPLNGMLGRSVSEQWLVALLQDLYRHTSGVPHWPGVVFPALRRDLEEHVVRMEEAKNRTGEVVHSIGILGVETAGSDLMANAPDPYWRFTEMLLMIPAEEDVEGLLAEIMGYFAVAGPDKVELALSRKYNNIKVLHAWLGLEKR